MLRSRGDCGRVRRPMRHAVASLAALLLLASGCKGQCRQLSEKLCDCSANTTTRTSCLQNAATREGSYPPTAEDEAACQALLDTCDCRLIDTPQGKVNCGLARNPDQ